MVYAYRKGADRVFVVANKEEEFPHRCVRSGSSASLVLFFVTQPPDIARDGLKKKHLAVSPRKSNGMLPLPYEGRHFSHQIVAVCSRPQPAPKLTKRNEPLSRKSCRLETGNQRSIQFTCWIRTESPKQKHREHDTRTQQTPFSRLTRSRDPRERPDTT